MTFLALVAALASGALASTDTMAGYDTPAFWAKSYAIPHSYCTHRLVAEAPKIDAHLINTIACPLANREPEAGSVYAICRLPLEEVEASVTALKRSTKTIFEKKDCVDAPSYPELSYKSRHLEEEFKAIGLSSQTTPGIVGLYGAQMKTLEILQAKHERAKTPTLEVYISTGGRCAGDACEKFLVSRWESSRDWQTEMQAQYDGSNPWGRSKQPACLQVSAFRVQLDVAENSSEAEEARRKLKEIGEPYQEDGCSRVPGALFMVFARKSLLKVQQAILDLPGLKSFVKNNIRGNFKRDDQRVSILGRELKALDPGKAPHLRAFVIAERERVKKTAEAIDKLNSGNLIIVSFASR